MIRYFQHFRGVMASGSLRVESSSFSGAAETRLHLRRAPAELNGGQIDAPSLEYQSPCPAGEDGWRTHPRGFNKQISLVCDLGAVTQPTGAPKQAASERLQESPVHAVCLRL